LKTRTDLTPANALSLEQSRLNVDCGLHVTGNGYSIEKPSIAFLEVVYCVHGKGGKANV
jgi:hypothetical protein